MDSEREHAPSQDLSVQGLLDGVLTRAIPVYKQPKKSAAQYLSIPEIWTSRAAI